MASLPLIFVLGWFAATAVTLGKAIRQPMFMRRQGNTTVPDGGMMRMLMGVALSGFGLVKRKLLA